MSTTIDEKVVEMRLDNRDFEKNAGKSMSTLDRLKQKLNLSGASKGLNDVNAAAKNNNLHHLSNAAETARLRLSAMEIVGMTAISNLANSAVNASKRMISALTIDPVRTGFNEYELKMDSIKTIMASTGESVETVNKYLNELNEYSDQTIYSFSDMTQNIGKFTNAGVKLEDAVMAIKGISNEAAVSGANANEASRAMYNFAQALSAGYVKLIDWKSIENANMATVEFKQQLIDMAVELGTVTKSADGMYQTLDGNLFSATKNFNEVFQDQWMTSEVLVQTLKQYADESTEIGKKAKAAAQDVTKLSQVFDIAKETAQSGWARTWEIMFGDINQAKAFFTPISNFINGIIDRMSDFRNNILEGALSSPFKGMSDMFNKFASAGQKATEVTEDLEAVISRVMGGEFGNGQERWDKLTEAGYDWATVQNKINEMLGSNVRHTSDLAEGHGELGKAQAKTIEQMLELSDAQLVAMGFTEEQVEAIRELDKEVSKTGYTLAEVLNNPDLMSGRSLIINSFKSMGKAIGAIIGAIKTAWQDIFPPKSTEEKAKGLYSFIVALHNFSSRIQKMFEDKQRIDKITRSFKGLFAALDIVFTLVSGPFKIAFKILKAVLGAFNIDILDFTAGIGDAIVKFRDWLKSNDLLTKGIALLVPWFKKAADAIKEWFKGLKEADNIPMYIIKGLVNGLKNGAQAVIGGIIELGKKLIEGFKKILGIHSPSVVFFALGGFIIAGLLGGLKAKFPEVFDIIKNFGKKIIDVFKNIDWGSLLTVGAFAGILATAFMIANAFNKIASAFDGLGDLFRNLGDGLEKVMKSFSKVMNAFAMNMRAKALKEMAIGIAILVGAVIALTFFEPADLWKSVAVVAALAAVLVALAWATDKIAGASAEVNKNGVKVSGFKTALLGMATALLMMAFVVKILGNLDTDKAIKGFTGMIILAGVMVGVMAAFGLLVKADASVNIDKAGKLFTKLAFAMILMIVVVKLIDTLEWGEIGKGIVGMGLFVLFVKSVLKATGTGNFEHFDKLGKFLTKMVWALMLMAVAMKVMGLVKWEEFGKGVVGMLLFKLFVSSLCRTARKLSESKTDISKFGKILMSIAGAMLIMTVTMKLMGLLSAGEILKGFGCMFIFTILMKSLIKTMGKMERGVGNMSKTIIAIGISIGILAGVTALLGLIDIDHLAKGLVAVGILSGLMTMMIKATKGAKDCKANLIVLTAAIAVLAGSLAALSLLDSEKLVVAGLVLSGVIGMFTVLIKSANSMGNVTGAAKNLGLMVGVIGVLALIVFTLGKLKIGSSLETCASLSLLMLSLAASMRIMDGVNGISDRAMNAMYKMEAAIAVLAIVIGALEKLGIEPSIPTAVSVGILLITLALSMEIMDGVNAISDKAIAAMYKMEGAIAVVGAILLALQKLGLKEGDIELAGSIGLLIDALAVAAVALTAVKADPIVMGKAAAGFDAFIAIVGALVTALGALMLIPGFDKLLEGGVNALTMLGEALGGLIGGFVGGIAGGVAEGLSSALPGIGEDLTDFMNNAQGFFDGLENVDDDVIDKAKKVAGALLEIAGAEALDSLALLNPAKWFADSFDEKLGKLGTGISNLVTNMEGVDKQDAMNAADILSAIATAASKIPNTDGLFTIFTGDKDLDDFADEFGNLGAGLYDFYYELGSTKLDSAVFGAAADALTAFATAAQGIPKTGLSFSSIFSGDSKLDDFANMFGALGTGLNNFFTNLGETVIDEDTAKAAGTAVSEFAKAAKDIPNEGGALGAIVGNNNIDDFAKMFKAVGEGLRDFFIAISKTDIDTELISKCATAIGELAKIEPPDETGVFFDWATSSDAEDFERFIGNLKKIGTGINDFVTNMGNVSVEKLTSGVDSITAIARVGDLVGSGDSMFTSLAGVEIFGQGIAYLGGKINEFYNSVSGVNTGTIDSVVDAIVNIVSIRAYTLDTLKTQGDNMVSFGTNFKKGYDSLTEVDVEHLGAILQSFDGLTESIKTAVSIDTASLITIGDNFASFGKGMYGGYQDVCKVTSSILLERINGIDGGITAANTMASVDSTKMTDLAAALTTLGDALKTFAENSGDFETAGINIANKIASAIDENSAQITTKVTDAIADAAAEGKKKASDFTNVGSTAMLNIKAGIALRMSEVEGMITNKEGTGLIDAVITKIRNKYSDFSSAGGFVAGGLAAGIRSKKPDVTSAAEELATATKTAIETILKIQSPSRVLYETGGFAGQGFVNALSDYSDIAYDKASEMGNSAKSGLRGAISKIMSVLSGDMDNLQPTIRPVVDLSAVQAGANSIGGLFGSDATIGVNSNLRAISSSMSMRGQNGGNSDLISEIKKLRGALADASGDTYNFGNFTYSGDDEVANAVSTLVRAATMERRA